MSDFDLIECGYNAADETINFGTRCLADGDNLYEASTLATLRASNPDGTTSNPYINTILINGRIYFSLDTMMRIFQDKQCTDVIFTDGFEAIIDTFCVSLEFDYILICLRNGMLRVIDCKNEYTCVFSKQCERDEDGDKFFNNSFLHNDSFVVVTKTGQVYKLPFQAGFTIECVHEFQFKSEVAIFQYPFLLVSGSKLVVLDLENNNTVSIESYNFKKIFPLANTHMFLALDFESSLFRICAITLLVYPIGNTTVYKDMELICGLHETQLLVVTKEESQQYLQMLSYPDFTKMYGLKVPNDVHLINIESINDDILYITKIFSENSLSEIRFHCVYETEPEQRLKRLLKRRKYEEAERFSTIFNLDKSLINKAKAEELVGKAICSSSDIDDLVTLLNAIDDDEFKLRCCLAVTCGEFEDVRKILSYGCKMELKKRSSEATEELQESVFNQMFRFETFRTIHRGTDLDMQSWEGFILCDLIERVKSLLRNYEIEEAKILYSRLDQATIENLTNEKVSDILDTLNQLPLTTSQPFVSTFIPITLSIQPSALPLFVEWIYNRVFYLEKHSGDQYPDNAIKFTENIVSLMNTGNVDEISFQRHFVLQRGSLKELSSLLPALKSLKTLKDDYGINIPVAKYISGPENVVRFLHSLKMHHEMYDCFLKNFLCKYIEQNHMDLNGILLKEIKELMRLEERYWVNIIGSILDCMTSLEVKLEAVKIILVFGTVPWSDTVRKIANDSLKCCHPATSCIRKLIESEPIQVVLRRPVYKIKERRIRDIDDLTFISNRIIYCNEPTMVKDVYTLCETSEHRHVVNMLLIRHFIRRGCFEKAIDILDDNKDEEIFICAKEVFTMTEMLINNKKTGILGDLAKNYYAVLGPIYKRLNAREKEFYRLVNEKTFERIKNVYNLEKFFNIKVTTYDLHDPSIKYGIIDEVLDRACADFKSEAIDELFTTCYRLSLSLSIDFQDILIRCCEKIGDYKVILRAAQFAYDNDTSTRNLSLMAVLLLKYAETCKLRPVDLDESIVLPTTDEIDEGVFCKGLRLAESIVAKAIGKAEPDEIVACMEVAQWVNVSFYVTRYQESDLKKSIFGDVFTSNIVLPTSFTFSTIKNVFNAFCQFLAPSSNTYLTHFVNTQSEENFSTILECLPSIVESLSKEGQHYTSFQIVSTLQNCLMQMNNTDETILFLNEILKKKCIPKLLHSVVSNHNIDEDFLYNLLLLCDTDDFGFFINKTARMYKRDPRKLGAICRTGIRLWDHHKLTSGRSEMLKNLITIKWWKKIENKKLQYELFFKSEPLDRFDYLVNSDCMDTKLVREYCQDYGLDLTAMYENFLKTVLLNWKPDYEIKDDLSKRYLIVNNSGDELLKKCHKIMKGLDQSRVYNVVTNNWNSINAYYYEVFIVMLHILSKTKPQQDNHTEMLYFLMNYQRVSKPSEPETEHWFTNFPDTRAIEPLSEFRLPFTPFLFTKQVIDIIRPEINLETYQLWFNVVDILKPHLTKNDICSYVVKDVVARGALSKGGGDGWSFSAKHDDVLKQIDECVANISDLERTTSVVYHLMTNTPPGADQVNAAKLCYRYAQEYHRLNPGSSVVERAFRKVETKYFGYCAMHILHTYDLAEKKYTDLLSQPKDLILALYLDDRILGKNEVGIRCPDINKATDALAHLFKLDIKQIRYSLIKSWLDFDASNFDFDDGDDSVLSRIAYICTDELEFWEITFLKWGYEEEQMGTRFKANALKVFSMISDVETIERLSDYSYSDFLKLIDKLTLISNLQYLGVSLDVEGLDQSNKKELLNRFAQHTGNVVAIKTMALICTTYEIYNTKYWEFIVNNAVKFSLFAEVKSHLSFLNKQQYHNKNFYINAWQKLVDNSFKSLGNLEQPDQILLCNCRMVQSCPVLSSLKLDAAFQACMDINKVEFAAILLQYVDGQKKNECIKVMHNAAKKDLFAKLDTLKEKGLWGVDHVKKILNFI